MLEFIYSKYSQHVGKTNLYSKSIRFLTSRTYNIVVPIIYRGSSNKNILKSEENDVIVSLTTFPDRIDKVWLVIESLFNQTKMPNKIVLTLSLKQFNGESSLPKELLKQKKRGLEIIWTDDDLKSHKKYYYVMQKYPNSNVVTVDDDFFYSKGMLENLLHFHGIYPDAVICHLAAKKNGLSYKKWKNLLFEFHKPSKFIMQYGGSGVLYPPNSLYKDAFNKDKIKKLCPLADDIWLNYMSILNNTYIVKTDYQNYLMPLFFKSTTALKKINVGEDMNSTQIKLLNEEYCSYL